MLVDPNQDLVLIADLDLHHDIDHRIEVVIHQLLNLDHDQILDLILDLNEDIIHHDHVHVLVLVMNLLPLHHLYQHLILLLQIISQYRIR